MKHIPTVAGAIVACVVLSCCAHSATSAGGKTPPHTYVAIPDAVYSKCVSSAVEMGWAVQMTDPKSRIITATTATNMLTWGDTVSIQVIEGEAGKTIVNVASQTRGQIIDYGRNGRNIQRFFSILDKAMEPTSAP